MSRSSAPVVTFHMRIWPLRPATAIRSPSGENATVRTSADGQSSCCVIWPVEVLMICSVFAEADDRELLTVRMKGNGRDRAVAGRRFEQPLAGGRVPQANRAIARAGGQRLAVGREGDGADPIVDGPRAACRTAPVVGVPNPHAVIVAGGGDRVAVGRHRDAGHDRRAVLVVERRIR